MKMRYYLCLKPRLDGSYYIHKQDCPFLPSLDKRILLGSFQSPEEASAAAKKLRKKIIFCRFCMNFHQERSILNESTYSVRKEDFVSSEILPEATDSIMVCGVN